ncbi:MULTISPECIES: aldehyde dehydrogenase family protein [Paraburkholderia]|uniref:Aldehyde dehydrogenase family protein n=1 Tax=Paraburkholderia podalyriae TaxID=1938811 RepID=A0ABR7Q1U0_9BURK|nr:aldehyde dehydrogenase family protein [Paraburkholderia podalyriae]MBC8752344.1 aldehyde dehydrogenase family protein [Paraburkholderia podalyriae]
MDHESAQSPQRKSLSRGQLLIDGKWRDASDGATLSTVDPTTEGKIADFAKATLADVNAAVESARRAFETGDWPRMHHEARARILFRMADLLDERAEDFALREAMDMGMPYGDFVDIIMPHCAGLFRFFGGLAMHAMDGAYRTSYEAHTRILTRREPLGVVAAITPFNFPLALTCSKVAPALAAGNTIVHKPASDTPLTALALAQVALDAGVPEGVYNLITGPGGSLGDALVKHPLVDKIAFTGSTSVGQTIIRNGADTLKHTTMELGGKSPNIIFADADVDTAVQAAFWGIFWNKGEVCVAGSRLLVERPVYDEVVEKLARMAQAAVLGDPLEPQTHIGPIASRAEFDKVQQYVEAGKASTARLVAGGATRKINGKGLFIEPTVFADATNDLKIGREEIFGPVLPVIPFDGEDEAVRIANDTPYGLASGIQTRDLGRALRLADRINAGTVWINTWHKYHPNGPFGGYKMSGYGREQGAEALDSYTQYKTPTGQHCVRTAPARRRIATPLHWQTMKR